MHQNESKHNEGAIGVRLAILCIAVTAASVMILMSFGGWDRVMRLVGGDSQAEEVLPRVEWPIGERRVYQMSYDSLDEIRPLMDGRLQGSDGEVMKSEFQIVAEVGVTGTGAGTEAGASRAEFEVLGCKSASWQVAGGVVWEDAAACGEMLIGASLGVEISETGQPLVVHDPEDASSAVQSVLQSLWLRMQLALPESRLPDGGEYWAQEETLQGTAGYAYTVRVADTVEIERETEAYVRVRMVESLNRATATDATGSARFSIDDDGRLRRAHGNEVLRVETPEGATVLSSEVAFSAVWQRDEKAPVKTAVRAWTTRPATSILESVRTQEKLLDNRIAGLDGETLLQTLRDPGFRPGGEGEARFLWQATGLLTKNPKLAWKLLPIASAENPSMKQRAHALDLLTSAGHDEAQAVLRQALGNTDRLLSGEASERRLYQRLGLLERPNLETAKMVAQHYQTLGGESATEARLTTAYSLGAIVRRLGDGNAQSQALADGYNRMLVDATRNPTNEKILAHQVSALGNTRRIDNVEIFDGLARHESGAVRESVANALGKIPTEAPPEALIGLLADADAVVQRNAIRAAKPHASVFEEVAAAARAGELASLNVRPVLDLVKEGRGAYPEETRQVLESLIDRGIENDADRELAYQLGGI